VEGVSRLEPLDGVFLQKLNEVISKVEEGYEELDTFEPSNLLKSFTWKAFADHYVEAVKSRAYMAGDFNEEQAKSAWYTLHTTIRSLLIMLHPIVPFVTDFLLRNLYGRGALEQGWVGKVSVPAFDSSLFDKFMDVNSSIWGYKKEKGLSLKSQLLCEVYLPKELEPFRPDLVAMHKLTKLSFSEPPEGVKTVTRGLAKFSE
jgi:valyl-tRNA synthetase